MKWKEILAAMVVGIGFIVGLALLMLALTSPLILIVWLIIQAFT